MEENQINNRNVNKFIRFKNYLKNMDKLYLTLFLTNLFTYLIFPIVGIALSLNINLYTLDMYYFMIYIVMQSGCFCLSSITNIVWCAEIIEHRKAQNFDNNYEKRCKNWERKQRRINSRNPNCPLCVVCEENVQTTRLNCGHTIMCYLCAKITEEKYGQCPICRIDISKIDCNYKSDGEDWKPNVKKNKVTKVIK